MSPRFNTTNYSISKFKKLAEDPRAKEIKYKYNRVCIDEARSIVQADLENIIIKPSRPDGQTARKVDLDFLVEGPKPYTHIDIKTPVGSQILEKQNQKITLEQSSHRLGKKIVDQKYRFVGQENGPVSAENVGHIVDLCYIPNHEKEIVRQNILQGAKEQVSTEGIMFLNDIK